MEQRSECQWVLASKDGTEHALPPGMIFIGRQECDIIVDSASVDKRHAVIFFNPSDKQFHVKDLNSVTGTYLNGIRIPEQSYVKLNHMDCLSPLSPVRLSQSPPESVPLRRISLSSSPATQSSSTASTARSPSTASTATLQSPSPSRPSVTSPTLGSGNRQDADSLEDLSRTEEDCSSSTVREVVPSGRPPPHPTTLAWKPLRARAGGEDSAVSNESPSPGELRPEAKQSPSKQWSHDSSDTPVEPSGRDSKEASPGSGPESPERQPPLSASNSMAFTIPFDDDSGGTPGRRFGLKDSIKKFAPPKPEAERTPTKLRPSSVSLAKEVPGAKKDERLSDSATYLIQRMLNDGPPRAPLPDKGLVNGGQGESRPSSGWKSDLPKSSPRQDERLSDSATYLIQRMLNDGPPRAPLPGPPSGRQTLLGGSSSEPQLVSPGDDRSETGTYTVEMDRADPAVEEARRKIDEVFGVPLRALPAGHDQASPLRPDRRVGGPGPPETSSASASVRTSPAGSVRPRARKRREEADQPLRPVFGCGCGRRRSQEAAGVVRRSAEPSVLAAEDASDGRDNETCFRKKQPSVVHATNMSQSVGPRIGCGGNRTTQPQRKPWGLSGSEADIAAAAADPVGAEETASVVSDTSTEPSSHSSGSRGGPTMKLNRAFALRRARLGLPDIGGLPPTAASGGSKKSLHGSNPSLSRQDGGRFSLRLPRGTRATELGRAELLRGKSRGMHQRNDSDPGAAFRSQQFSASDGERQSPRPSRRGGQRTGASSCISDGDDDGLRTGSPVLFNRSASFGAPNDPTPSVPERRKSRGTAFSRGETFLKGAREGSDGGALGGTFVRSSRGKVERQSGDGESKTPTENGIKTPSTTTPGRRELSALDSLVISAIHQLSGKLRTSARTLIERERFKYPENSDVRLMIEEVLPRVVERRPGDSPTEGNLTKELSTILKNLKRIEQSLEVLNSLGPGESVAEKTVETKTTPQKPRGSFFYVDV
ncbi:hypothetical protein IscW_ISCW020890 [Ixodes scapularis]|uniref:FHA domain-containing protein n=1 Tax=Ixodes scapularis TaxID=6945 RepID=B7Q7N2_IXOSC|nr:hypothetical protein IscW_ISCW020890 [Ixodes scapularis]|eukprot:XP_002404227.1 hypothetical protein IscW_ISCW020890 [Ixodes scapularis]